MSNCLRITVQDALTNVVNALTCLESLEGPPTLTIIAHRSRLHRRLILFNEQKGCCWRLKIGTSTQWKGRLGHQLFGGAMFHTLNLISKPTILHIALHPEANFLSCIWVMTSTRFLLHTAAYKPIRCTVNLCDLRHVYLVDPCTRIVLNAGMPAEKLMCKTCTLYRAIVNHNFHLRRLYSLPPPSEPDIDPSYQIGSCPNNIDSSFKVEVAKLEHILPNSRNLDFTELGQLISMTPYIVLPSIPSFKEKMKRPRRTILVDAGPNQFYGQGPKDCQSLLPHSCIRRVPICSPPSPYKQRSQLMHVSLRHGALRT